MKLPCQTLPYMGKSYYWNQMVCFYCIVFWSSRENLSLELRYTYPKNNPKLTYTGIIFSHLSSVAILRNQNHVVDSRFLDDLDPGSTINKSLNKIQSDQIPNNQSNIVDSLIAGLFQSGYGARMADSLIYGLVWD